MKKTSGRRSRSRKKRREQIAVFAVLVVTVLIAVAGAAWFLAQKNTPSTEHMDASAYFNVPSAEEVTVCVTGTVCERKALRGTRTAYIAYEDAVEYINPRIYFDEKSWILTVATPEEIINTYAEQASVPGEQDAVLTPDGLYISAEFLQKYSDIEIGALTDAPQFVIRTDFTLPEASVIENTPVRMNPDLKSVIVRDLTEGETVTVLETGEKYTRVMTQDGFIGSALSEALGTAVTPEAHTPLTGEYTHLTYDFPITMVFHQTDSQAANAALAESLAGTHGINIIAPTWYFLNDTEGGHTDLASKEYTDYAHSVGMKVWAVANDFDGSCHSPADTLAFLSDTEARQAYVAEVVASVKEAGADGINLDFENVREDSAAPYLMMIREFAAACGKEGLVLSVDSYVPQNYNLYLNRTAQAEAADYIVTMAYDEHYAGSSEAGSVSSISWVKQAVEGTGKEVPMERIIIALPFYTRVWESSADNTPTSRAMGMREAAAYVQSLGVSPVWDDTVMQEYAEAVAGTKRQVWLENERSLRAKLELLQGYDIAGTAAWKLGLETPEIWDLMEEFSE